MLRKLFIASLLALLAVPASANLFLDEDFEDGTPFTNNNYPVRDDDTTPPSLVPTGLNIRCNGADQAAAPQFAVANNGTVVSSAAFKGTSCLQLASGQSVAVDNSGGLYTSRDQNNHVVMQFALSFPDSVFGLPASTRVGHYAQNWDTDNEATPGTELTYQLNFVRNGSNGVDIIVSNDAVVADTITTSSEWTVVTVIAAKAQDAGYGGGYSWLAWDPFTSKFKGPQPTGANPIAGTATADQLSTLACGIHLYVNSNTDTDFISNTGLGATPTWCATDGTKGETRLETWSLTAENGGTLLVDDMYYSVANLQGVRTPTGTEATQPNYISQEDAARLLEFTVPPPPLPPTDRAGDWSLYQ